MKTRAKARVYAAGDAVVLSTAPHSLRHYAGRPGEVLRVWDGPGGQFAEVALLTGKTEEDPERTCFHFACSYLDPAPAETPEKPARRGAFHLHPPKDTRPESERQAEGVAWLRREGYTVLEVGQGRKGVTCPQCNHFAFPRGWQGNTPGTPDTFVARPDYPAGCWLAVEWKAGPDAERRPEQKGLEEAGRIRIAWDLRSCLLAVYEFEDALGLPVHQPVIDWLVRHDAVADPHEATTEENCA